MKKSLFLVPALFFISCTSYSESEKVQIILKGDRAMNEIQSTVDTIDHLISIMDAPEGYREIMGTAELGGPKLFLLQMKDNIEGKLEEKDHSGIMEEVKIWERAKGMVSDSIQAFRIRFVTNRP